MKLIVYCAAIVMVVGFVAGCSSEPEAETATTPETAAPPPDKGGDPATGGTGGMPRPGEIQSDDLTGG